MTLSLELLLRRSTRRARSAALVLCLALVAQNALAAPPAAGTGAERRDGGRVMRLLRRGSGATLGVTNWASKSLAPLLARESRLLSFSLRGLGLVGAGGLVVSGAHGLCRARDPAERFDRSTDLAFGLRGLSIYAAGAGASTAWQHLAQGLGATGGLCQIGGGVCRIRLGLAQHDRSLLRLGALDVGVGVLSVGWSLASASPWLIGAYVAAVAGREAYANRELLKSWGQKIGCFYDRCRARLGAHALR
jgi:hypothetical protein